MTNDTLRRRRSRRLLPAAVAAITLASSAPLVAPTMARADTGTPRPERREHVRPANPGKIPALLRTDVTRGVRLQGVSTT
jgi:hypothetical protein